MWVWVAEELDAAASEGGGRGAAAASEGGGGGAAAASEGGGRGEEQLPHQREEAAQAACGDRGARCEVSSRLGGAECGSKGRGQGSESPGVAGNSRARPRGRCRWAYSAEPLTPVGARTRRPVRDAWRATVEQESDCGVRCR